MSEERKPTLWLDMPTDPNDPTPVRVVVKYLTDKELAEAEKVREYQVHSD